MKILYAIQGTGNGHISRAGDIIAALQKKGTVDVLVSGTESDLPLPIAPKFICKGLSFVFGKNGGVDILATYKKARLKRFYDEIKQLSVKDYDIVINDFEPVSAWACKLHGIPCVALSHQVAVLNKNSPRPKNFDPIGKIILKNYAPYTLSFGFHFLPYDKRIFTPVIRQEVRKLIPTDDNHYTVYLPSYSDKKILKVLSKLKETNWEVFSKNTPEFYQQDHIKVFPIKSDTFINSMASSSGVLCGAGFETPAEALYLDKKLLVIPMKNQYEQQCNAAALKKMGVKVLKKLKTSSLDTIKNWIENGEAIIAVFPDETDRIVDKIFEMHSDSKDQISNEDFPHSPRKLKKQLFGNLLHL